MKTRPDVAILLPDLRGGGVERMRLHLAEAFVARGLRVELVLLESKGDLVQHIPPGVELVDLAAPRLRRSLFPLTRYLRRSRPESLLAAMWPLTSIAIVASQGSRGTRVVISDHNTLSLTPLGRTVRGRLQMRASIRYLYPRADKVITPSIGVKEDLESLGAWTQSPIEVVPNPVIRLKRPPIPPLPADHPWLQPGPPKLISIGTLKEQKDYPTLFRAIARLSGSKAVRLLVLGEGRLRAPLETLVRSLGLENSILMPGFVQDVRPYLAASDLFVLASAWEGFGNVIVEALEQGVPVVSTDCPSGPSEILGGGEFGTLVPVGDPEALTVAIATALATRTNRPRLIERASMYSVEAAASRYLEALLPQAQDYKKTKQWVSR